MTKERNYGHSVYVRLLSTAKKGNLEFAFVLQRYGMERFLHRLSISPYSDEFILKGASLFLVWKGQNFRATKDADFLSFKSHDEKELAEIIREICSIPGYEEDGIIFETDSIEVEPIREEQAYGGTRVTLLARLYNAKISLQIDIGYGDVVTPSPENVIYPTILNRPAPHLRAYTRYSLVSEKLNVMVELGLANSRMKDFYDIWLVSNLFEFDFNLLCASVKDTFERRKTDIPGTIPLALTTDFSGNPDKITQWDAFVKKSKPNPSAGSLSDTVRRITDFLLPVIESIRDKKTRRLYWRPGTGWTEKELPKPAE